MGRYYERTPRRTVLEEAEAAAARPPREPEPEPAPAPVTRWWQTDWGEWVVGIGLGVVAVALIVLWLPMILLIGALLIFGHILFWGLASNGALHRRTQTRERRRRSRHIP